MLLYLEDASENKALRLRDGEYVVGCSRAADIRIVRRGVSGRHALFRVDGRHLFVSDLGSRKGTDIDGVFIASGPSETEVMPNSTVHVAGVALSRFQAAPTPVVDSTLELISFQDYSDDSRGLIGAAASDEGELVSALFAMIAAEGMLEGFEDQVCLFVGHWINCDRVVLLLDFGPGSQFDVWGSWSMADGFNAEYMPDESLVDKVRKTRASLLLARDTGDMMAVPVASAMAVPLIDNERVRGILYAETSSPLVEFDRGDLDILTTTANVVAVKLTNRDLNHAMTVAQQIQRRMCPASLPDIPGYEVAARLESCFAVGGDFYHVGEPIAGKVLVAIGDVAGKGLPAALAMAACAVLIPALDGFCDQPCTLVQQLHHSLRAKLSPDQYITLFLGELDLACGDLRYVNAGHVPPMVLRAGGEVERLGSTGGVMGMFPEFVCRGKQIRLEPGDLLTVFTDGVTEATIHGDEFFEREMAEAVILEHRVASLPEIVAKMFDEIEEFLRGGHESDDTTLLLLRREP